MLIGTAILSVTVPAEACAVSRTAEEKLRDSYAAGIFSGVAAVTIADAKYLRNPQGDSHVWSATATVDTMLMGTSRAKTVTIERGGGSSACDDDIIDSNSLPRRGEKWIVYFWTSPQRGQLVWIGYPHGVAACADPALGPSMKFNPNVKPNVAIPLRRGIPKANGTCRFAVSRHK